MRNSTRSVAALLSLLTAAAPRVVAQQPTRAINLDDMVNSVSASVGDLTADGRWLVVRTSTVKDGFGSQGGTYHFGDITYRYDTPSDLWIIDTKTGDKRRVFPDRRTTAGGTWSPDGATLVLTTIVNNEVTPVLWDRANGKTKTIPVPAGFLLDGAPSWSEDGKRVSMTLHTEEWRRRSKAFFDSLVNGPIVVLDGKDPFLEWDELGRRRDLKALAVYDVATGKTAIALPEARYASAELSPDGALIRYTESLKPRTDYSGMSPGDMKVWLKAADGSGTARVVIPTTKGLTVAWAKDGKHYAYTKEKSVYVGSVDDATPKQTTGSNFIWAPEGLSYAYMNGDDKVVADATANRRRR